MGCGRSTAPLASAPSDADAGRAAANAGDGEVVLSEDAGRAIAEDTGATVGETAADASDEHSTSGAQDGGNCISPEAPALTLQSLATPCYGGATGQQLLALVAPTYTTEFVPQGPPQATRGPDRLRTRRSR